MKGRKGYGKGMKGGRGGKGFVATPANMTSKKGLSK